MFDFLSQRFSSLFSTLTGKGILSQADIDAALQKVKEALLEADVPYELVNTFCQEIAQKVTGQKVIASLKPADHLMKIVFDTLKQFLTGKNQTSFSFQLPSTILMMGLQGSGKTTTCAKLAGWVSKEAEKNNKKRRILLASVDFYRPAAIDQLAVVAQQAGASFYRATATCPLKAAQEIQQYAQHHSYELLFLDTAGRLHVDQAMLEELKSIEQALKPRHKIMVLDAMTGQESLRVAQTFENEVGFDGAILTKVDSETRSGAAFSFCYALKKPILFVGSGEKIADLERFYPDRMAQRILGMGDIISLAEKAEQSLKKAEQESLTKSLQKGQLTLLDFAQQLEMMSQLGSFSQLLKYMPGMGAAALSPEAIEKAEVDLKKFRAIIGSMTPKERLLPAILDSSRKNRIAKGAGVAPGDIQLLISRFEQSKQYVKLLKFGKTSGLFR